MRLTKIQRKLTEMNIQYKYDGPVIRGANEEVGAITFKDAEDKEYILTEYIVASNKSLKKILASGMGFDGYNLKEEDIIDWLDKNSFRFAG